MYAHQTWKPYTAKCKLSPWIDVLNELNMELGCFNLETIPVTRNLVEIRYHWLCLQWLWFMMSVKCPVSLGHWLIVDNSVKYICNKKKTYICSNLLHIGYEGTSVDIHQSCTSIKLAHDDAWHGHVPFKVGAAEGRTLQLLLVLENCISKINMTQLVVLWTLISICNSTQHWSINMIIY